jgi:hypothetical protein
LEPRVHTRKAQVAVGDTSTSGDRSHMFTAADERAHIDTFTADLDEHVSPACNVRGRRPSAGTRGSDQIR